MQRFDVCKIKGIESKRLVRLYSINESGNYFYLVPTGHTAQRKFTKHGKCLNTLGAAVFVEKQSSTLINCLLKTPAVCVLELREMGKKRELSI